MDFSNKSDVINKVISRTKKGQIIWKPTHIGSRGAFYLSEYTLTKTKKLILRFNINIDVWEMFLFICVKENGKEKTGLTIFSNDLRTDDFDILYHIIKYSDKKSTKEKFIEYLDKCNVYKLFVNNMKLEKDMSFDEWFEGVKFTPINYFFAAFNWKKTKQGVEFWSDMSDGWVDIVG